MAKRRSLFTEYAFEIGVLTLPAYLSLLAIGVNYLWTKPGIALVVLGLIGTLASMGSIKLGYPEIKW